MNQLSLTNIKLIILNLIIFLTYVKCQGGFSDQIYSSKIAPSNKYVNNNNKNQHATATGDISHGGYSLDELENKFIIDVIRNKDGKLEPFVRRPTTTSSSTLTASSGSIPDSRINNPSSASSQHPTTNYGIIHFPTEDYSSAYELKNDKNVKNLRPKCNSNGIGNSFCTQVDNYPVEAVLKAIQQDKSKFEAVFGEDLLPEQQTEISQRIDPEFGEESLCQSRERLIFPQAGLTKDNNWSFIINHENYTQGIRVEECINPGRPCLMSENFPNGYRTECKQKYIYRQLLSMSENGVVKKDLFQLPSCCKCYIKTF